MPNTNPTSSTWPTYTRVPENLWQNIQMNAGIVVKGFDPTDGSYDSIIGATDGGTSFNPNPEFYDMGEGIDNLPANTMQLKKIRSYDPTMSGTFKSLTSDLVKMLNAAVDTEGAAPIHIVPRMELTTEDFEEDVTLIADYSDVNTGETAGWLAVRIFNALNTTGFQWQTQNQDKGQFAFEFHGHYDLNDLDKVPFDIYMKQGYKLKNITVTSEAGTTSGKSKITVSGYTLGSGESYKYKTDSSTAPSVSYGDDLSSGWTALTSGSEITPTSGHTKITVAIADSNGKAIGSGSATLVVNS